MLCFDSKLVRLKVAEWESMVHVVTQFRFQTGSIKRLPYILLPKDEDIGFDSKLVRLKDLAFHTPGNASKSFDSKLVRLKGKGVKMLYDAKKQFRFQTGSIKSKHLYLHNTRYW